MSWDHIISVYEYCNNNEEFELQTFVIFILEGIWNFLKQFKYSVVNWRVNNEILDLVAEKRNESTEGRRTSKLIPNIKLWRERKHI